MKQYITTREAAELIGISVQGVHYAIKEGYIEAQKLGRDWIVEYNSVLTYKQQREESDTGKYPRQS